MVKIAILDDYQDCARSLADWSLLKDAEITVFRDHLFDEAAVADRLKPFDIVCAMRERTALPATLLEKLPNLKLIATTGMWNAAIDIEAAKARGITVCGTLAPETPTAELTWALILALTRNIPAETTSIRNGGWQVTVGSDLAGRTLGILGMGRLGSKVAKVGLAFGMKVVTWSQNITEERAEAAGARMVTKEELFRESDILSVLVILSHRTRGLVGAADLALMKPSAYLINTARGPIVDEAALVDVLRQKKIAGAAIDVYDPEPIAADHPFRSLPNVVATGHVGYVSQDTYRQFWGETVENIAAFLKGAPIRVIGQGGYRSAYDKR